MENLVPDDHDPNEDASYADIRMTFYDDGKNLDEDGNPTQTIGGTEIHVHHVGSFVLVDALLLIARKVIADEMADQMFNENVPADVRAEAADLMATHFLQHRLGSKELHGSTAVDMTVPNDASELFD